MIFGHTMCDERLGCEDPKKDSDGLQIQWLPPRTTTNPNLLGHLQPNELCLAPVQIMTLQEIIF